MRFEVYAGDKANDVYGPNTWLPEETLDMINKYLIAIKGASNYSNRGGIRSINVALDAKIRFIRLPTTCNVV